MNSNVQVASKCPRCQQTAVVCRYNFFDRGDLQVHAWEHKCSDCGWRETKAYRSDAPAPAAEDPAACPWCQRRT